MKSERDEFKIGGVYWSGKNPPTQGRVPQGYEWESIKDRFGRDIVGHRLVPIGRLESGPPLFTTDELNGTSALPPLGSPITYPHHVADATAKKEDD